MPKKRVARLDPAKRTTRAPRRAAAARTRGDARRPLSRERIVAAALAEIAAVGLADFSTRRLGTRLGVEAMSIYHHFPSKQHLLDALVEHALASQAPPPVGAPAIERLRHAMHEFRAMAQRFPALFPMLAVHRLNMPAGLQFIESILKLIHDVARDDELAARYFRVLGYYLMGAGLDEAAGYARGPSAAQPAGPDFVARECPQLARAGPFFAPQHWDATFELGVRVLLDSLQYDAQRLHAAAAGA